MLKPSADIILGQQQSRYSLVVAVSKRAREIAANAESKGEIIIEKPVDLAVHEIMDHKYIIIEHVEPESARIE